MTNLAILEERMEKVRKELDEAAINGMSDQRFYELSLKMDKLIEAYIDAKECLNKKKL